jgi:hypothetical protein
MANALYNKAKQGLLSGLIDLDTAVIKCALVSGYTPTMSSSTHEFVSDVVSAGGTLQGATAMTGCTTTNGVFNADPTTMLSVPAGAACSRVLIYQASAVTGGADVATNAQRVIALIDTAAGGASFSITPNGGNITITWDTGASKIFAL